MLPQKINPIAGLIYNRMNQIDMGIAIYHIAAEGGEFKFAKAKVVPECKGYVYTGTVQS